MPADRKPQTPAETASLDTALREIQRVADENERLFQQLRASERHFRRLSKATWMIQEEERRRLARELHDGIGQTLTALKNQLQRLALTDSDTPVREQLPRLVELAGTALRDTRELSRLLRPPVLDDLGLEAGLQWLMRHMQETGGLKVHAEIAIPPEPRLDPELETLIFRVAQEGLNNILKHAGRDEAWLTLNCGDAELRLEIADRGRGFETAALARQHDGVGIRGMRDRVELFGGRLDVDSAPDQGTRLRMRVPAALSAPGDPA